MAFQLRMLDTVKYRDLTAELHRVVAKDQAALAELIDVGRTYLDSEAFERCHPHYDWLKESWLETLAAAEAGLLPTEQWYDLVSILVAAVAMPEFQFSTMAADEPSPNLVVLGDEDGRLYGVLCNMSRWFDRLLLDLFKDSCVRYPYGASMVLFERETMTKLYDLLGRVEIPAVPAAGFCDTIERQRSLCERCLAAQYKVIALTNMPP